MPRNSVKRQTQQTVEQPQVVEQPVVKQVVEQPVESVPVSRRPAPTRENIETEFDELLGLIEEELNKMKSSSEKIKGSKFLKTLGRRLKTLKTRSLRIAKQKNVSRRNNTNSGFLKPVPISKELATFTSWNPNELHSRVDVTKFICSYVKDNNLQDPSDRRLILVDKNPKLKTLLGFQGESPAMRYCDLQTHLKQHFPSTQKTEPPPKETKPRKARA